MSKIAILTTKHPLVGVWRSADTFTSVELLVAPAREGFTVRAVDTEDQEEAEIFECRWNGETLTFAAHWRSTGRLIKYTLRLIEKDNISVSFTYSGQEAWLRAERPGT